MAFSIEESLDRYVAKLEEPREPDGLWHPSSLYGCDRKALYVITGTPESNPADARAKRVFRVGHLLHAFIQDAITDDPAVEEFYPEVSITHPELGVTGHGDGLIKYRATSVEGISIPASWEMLEFKTIKSTAFKYGELPKPEHVGQVMVYVKTLRDVGGRYSFPGGDEGVILPMGNELARARLVYVSKDDLQISEHTAFFTAAKDRDLIQRIADLDQYRSAGQLPDRLPDTVDSKTKKTKRAWQCSYCPYRAVCWES